MGPWQAFSAPVTIDPTGDDNNGPGKHCGYYIPSLVPTATGNAVMMVTPRFVAGSNTRCDVRFGVGPIGTLPLYAPFDSGDDTGWSTYGGSWTVSGGVYTQTGGLHHHRTAQARRLHDSHDDDRDGCRLSCGTATAQSTASWDQSIVGVTEAACLATGSAGIRGMIAATDFTEFAVTKG